MTLLQIRYALLITEVGSMNRAAELLFMSQPAITSAVHDLEEEIGITIFSSPSIDLLSVYSTFTFAAFTLLCGFSTFFNYLLQISSKMCILWKRSDGSWSRCIKNWAVLTSTRSKRSITLLPCCCKKSVTGMTSTLIYICVTCWNLPDLPRVLYMSAVSWLGN